MDLEFVYMNYIGNILAVGNVSDVLLKSQQPYN